VVCSWRLGGAVTNTAEDLAELAELEFEQVAGDAWACSALASAVEVVRDASTALPLAERATEQHPQAAGVRLVLASLLLRVFRTAPGRGPRNAPALALQHALTARDQRRAWGGDSAQAVVVACEAAMAAGEHVEAIRLGTQPPHGEALPSEAAFPAVVQQVAQAASACGAEEPLAAAVEQLPAGSTRHLFMGHLLKRRAAPREEVVACYQAALDSAATAFEHDQAVYCLTAVGVPLSDPADLKLVEGAEQNEAVIEAARAWSAGNFQAAIERLRPFVSRTSVVAELLAETYLDNQEPKSAADVLAEAGRRFSVPLLLLKAARIHLDGDDVEACDDLTQEALALGGMPASTLRSLYLLRIEAAQAREAWTQFRVRTQEALAALPGEAGLRWLLVRAFWNEQEFEQAWQELTRPPQLRPMDPRMTQLAMWLCQHSLAGAKLSARLLELLDSFPADADVQATALLCSAGEEFTDVPADQAERWSQLNLTFYRDHPEHPALHPIHFPQDDPQAQLAVLRGLLEPGARAYMEMVRKVATGGAPYGMLAVATGKPYLAALLHRAAGCWLIDSGDSTVRSWELEAAHAAINGDVSVDVSALVIGGLIPDYWRRVTSIFKSLRSTSHVRADAVAAQLHFRRLTQGSMGWDIEADRPVITEHDPAVMGRLQQSCDWVVQQLRGLSLVDHVVSDPRLRDLPLADAQPFLPWLSPVDLAASRQLPMFSDDAALRAIARSLGVPSFGSAALLEYFAETCAVGAPELRSWRQELRRQVCVDLPIDVGELAELADAEGWQPRAVALALSRPATWMLDNSAPLRLWHYALERVADDPPALAAWVEAAIQGYCAGKPPGVTLVLAQLLLVKAWQVAEDRDAAFGPMLWAANRACERLGVDRLLEQVVTELHAMLAETHAPDLALRMIVTLANNLPEVHRGRALRVLLTPATPIGATEIVLPER
jgi:hypothetical protein